MTDLIERIARAICRSEGCDPDFCVAREGGSPDWILYADNARAVLADLTEARLVIVPRETTGATINVDFEDLDEAERTLEAIVELLGNMGQIGTVSMVRHTTVEEENPDDR